jgi:coatomer subunit beta
VTLGPGESANVFATIKVSSTESGIVFGYATFDRKSALDKEWLVLNEIHADVVDYMQAGGQTQESTFKTMWQEFEWENKIAVNTNIREPEAFIELLSRHTNLQLVGSLERTRALLRSSQFVAVNMYAKSIFGEDALANVSLERNATSGDLGGTVRIRSRTQGIALSLGDKMTHVQREQKMRGA